MLQSIARAFGGFADALTIIGAVIAALILIPLALVRGSDPALIAIAITCIPAAVAHAFYRPAPPEKPAAFNMSKYDDILKSAGKA